MILASQEIPERTYRPSFEPCVERLDDFSVPFETFYGAVVLKALGQPRPITFSGDALRKSIIIEDQRYAVYQESQSDSDKEYLIFLDLEGKHLLANRHYSDYASDHLRTLVLLEEEHLARTVFNELTRFLREGKVVAQL